MERFSFKWLAAIATLGLLSVVALAQSTGPAAQISLGATPTIASPGSTVTVFGSITNTSSRSEKVTINYDVVGPCNYRDAYSLEVSLKRGETRTLSTSQTAPACAGDYVITATATSGNAVLDVKSVTVTVQ